MATSRKAVEKPLISVATADASTFTISFNGTELFSLTAKENRIAPIAHNIDPKALALYYWTYNGQVTVDESKPVLSVRSVNEDQRGSIYAVEYRGAEIYNLIVTREGFARGGHFHPYPIDFAMPVGRGIWSILRDGKWTKVEQSAGTTISIDAGEIHYVVTSEDSLLTEKNPKNERFTATNDKESRDLVEQINKDRLRTKIE